MVSLLCAQYHPWILLKFLFSLYRRRKVDETSGWFKTHPPLVEETGTVHIHPSSKKRVLYTSTTRRRNGYCTHPPLVEETGTVTQISIPTRRKKDLAVSNFMSTFSHYDNNDDDTFWIDEGGSDDSPISLSHSHQSSSSLLSSRSPYIRHWRPQEKEEEQDVPRHNQPPPPRCTHLAYKTQNPSLPSISSSSLLSTRISSLKKKHFSPSSFIIVFGNNEGKTSSSQLFVFFWTIHTR